MTAHKNYAIKKAEYRQKSLEYYTPKEEIWNSISHFIGGVLGLFAFVYLMIKANTNAKIVAALIAGVGGSIPYFLSAIYHFIQHPQKKLVARKIDYSGVCFIVVACGAPLAIAVRINAINMISLAACFAFCAIIVVLAIINVQKFSRKILLFNLFIAAVIIFLYFYNFTLLHVRAKIWFAVGAFFCGVGLAFYGIKRQYLHACFHVLMVLGTISFFHAGVYIFL